MTKITLLERLKEFSEARTRDLLLPVQMQEEDEAPPPDRAPPYTSPACRSCVPTPERLPS